MSNDSAQTAETPASAEELVPTRHTPAQRVQHILHGNPALSPLIVLVVAVIVFGIFADNFLRPQALSLLVQQVAVVGALAVGQTVIILTAGIDLSIGMAMVLSSLVMVKLNSDQGVPGLIALLIGIGVGLLTGLLNGVLVTRLNLPPFIVTLGTLLDLHRRLPAVRRRADHRARPRCTPRVDRQDHQHRQRQHHLGSDPDAAALPRRRVRAAQHGLGATSVRHRRRPRGLPARRHQRPTGCC